MNLDQIINMISRMLFRRAASWGINKSINMATGKGKAPAKPGTPQEKHLSDQGRDAAKLARKAARITRRIGR